jgi:hypothetical protein
LFFEVVLLVFQARAKLREKVLLGLLLSLVCGGVELFVIAFGVMFLGLLGMSIVLRIQSW